MRFVLICIGALFAPFSFRAVAQEGGNQMPEVGTQTREAFDQVLEFLYTAAHWIGQSIAELLQSLLPSLTVSPSLVDSIGYLALVTVLLVVMKVAERVAWIVVIIGWVLIVVRLGLIVTNTSL